MSKNIWCRQNNDDHKCKKCHECKKCHLCVRKMIECEDSSSSSEEERVEHIRKKYEIIKLIGPPGPRGRDGKDGINGSNGAPGAPGAPGESIMGVPGLDGLPGLDGSPFIPSYGYFYTQTGQVMLSGDNMKLNLTGTNTPDIQLFAGGEFILIPNGDYNVSFNVSLASSGTLPVEFGIAINDVIVPGSIYQGATSTAVSGNVNLKVDSTSLTSLSLQLVSANATIGPVGPNTHVIGSVTVLKLNNSAIV